MSPVSNPAGERPWYRQFWLWFVLAPLIATVIGGFATLIIAGSPPALVVDDFGQIAMAVEQDQKRDQRAAELGLVARLQLGAPAADGGDGRTLRVALAGDAPQTIRLHFIHPTRDDLDRHYELARAGDGYAGQAQRPDTRVYVQLTDTAASWRLAGELGPGQTEIELRAGPVR